MLAMLNRGGYLVLFSIILLTVVTYNFPNLVSSFTADGMTEIVQELSDVSANDVKKIAIGGLIDAQGEAVKGIKDFIIDVIDKPEAEQNVDFLFNFTRGLTGFSSFDSFIDGFTRAMKSKLNVL